MHSMIFFQSDIETLTSSREKLKNFAFSHSVLLQYLYSMMPLRKTVALGNSQKILIHMLFPFYKFTSHFKAIFSFSYS